MPNSLFRLFGLFGFAACLALWGQNAAVTGIVTDSSGGLVAGVTVRIRNIDTNVVRTIATNTDGNYSLTSLPPGPYELTAEIQGFRTYKQTGIVLETGDALRSDIQLAVGNVTESVSVTADAATLNTERGALQGDVVVQREIQDMPLEGRSFMDLATLVPGVAPQADGNQAGGGLNVAGSRADGTNYYVDGFSSRDVKSATFQSPPSLGAIQEFRMEVSGFSAEYGRMAGGVMNMVLRSGTNQYHGELFEYVRNNLIDSRAFFDTTKPALHRNQFGAVFHGPVRLPKLYDGRNRSFFMFSWESQRQLTGTTGIAHVPSLLEREGDFSQVAPKITDPFNGNTPFAGALIPKSRFNPVSVKLLPYYPLPNRADPRNNFTTVASNQGDYNAFIVKIDHRFNDKNNLSFRYQGRNSNSSSPFAVSNLGTMGTVGTGQRTLSGVNFIHLFTPALLVEVNSGFSRGVDLSNGVFGGRDIASEIGLTGTARDPYQFGFPWFLITGYDSLGTGYNLPTNAAVTGIQAGGKFTWVKSKHVMKWGWDILGDRHNEAHDSNNRGTYNFTGSWTSAPMADFVLGVMNSTTRQLGGPHNYMRNKSTGGFFTDDFKVLPNLTLNLGVRYEVDTLPHDKYNNESNFVPSLGKIVMALDETPALDAAMAAVGIQNIVTYASKVGLPRSLVYPDYNNIAPRFGFAWTPRKSRTMVIRGGYGIFYTGTMTNQYRNNLASNYPFGVNETYNRVANRPDLVNLSNPFPSDHTTLGGVTGSSGINIHSPMGYMQNYNLTIEREIGGGTAVEIGYAGSKGTHIARMRDINLPRYSTEAYLANVPVANLRPFPFLNGAINLFNYMDNSIYNSGQVSLRKRGRGGAFYRISYNYSKSIDLSSQLNQTSTAGLTAASQDLGNSKLDRARSDWDRGHIVTASFSWMLPFGRGGKLLRSTNAWQQGVIGGWQISGTSFFGTGYPITVVTSGTNLNLGESYKPNRLRTGIPDGIAGQRRGIDYPWFVLNDFVKVPGCISVTAGCPKDKYGFQPFVYGNSGRNIIDGPGLGYVNLSMMKNFRLSEQKSFQFRVDSFNIMNHPNFKVPNNQYNVANGGLITSVVANGRGGARVFQAALKFGF